MSEGNKERETKVVFEVVVAAYGKPSQDIKTVQAAARALQAAFGDGFRIWYDDSYWEYDSKADDGHHSGHDIAFKRGLEDDA